MNNSLQGLQFLRFLAIFLVVFAHIPTIQNGMEPGLLSGGAIGVDIFFIISGFIMMYITNDSTNPLKFFIKRFLRIAPLNLFL